MQKIKWLSEEALPIAVKRREAKSERAKERFTHLNEEFQRISRRDKKAFLSNQGKLFQILKDDAVKVLHSICEQIWKTQQWAQDRKTSVFIPIPKKGNAKEWSNYQHQLDDQKSKRVPEKDLFLLY